MSKHDPGPVETLARLALQSDRYSYDGDFRDAVDAVFGVPIYDAAPDLLAALEEIVHAPSVDAARATARAAIAKATGKEDSRDE